MENQDETIEKPVTKPTRRGRPVGSTTKKWQEILENAAAEEIADVLHLLPKGAQAKIYYLKAGRKRYLGSVLTSEVDALGGFEEFIQTNYGGGSYFVQICTTGKRITRSFALDVAGQPTETLISLLAEPAISPFRKVDQSVQSEVQPNPWNVESNKENEMLKARLDAMERKAEQNEIIGAFQAENDEIKKQLSGLQQTIEKQSERKPDSSAWKELIPVAASGLGGLVGIFQQMINDRPSSTDMLKSSASMVRGISDFMTTLKDLNPAPPPPPPTSDQTGTGLDAILKAAAPKLIEALSNRAVAPGGTQQPARPTSEAMPLAQDVSQSPQNGNFPRTQEKLNELSALISQRINADVVADALIEIFSIATEENAVGMFPELIRLESDPQSALDSFLGRFPLEGVEGQGYKQKIMDSVYRKFLGQAAPVDESVSVDV